MPAAAQPVARQLVMRLPLLKPNPGLDPARSLLARPESPELEIIENKTTVKRTYSAFEEALLDVPLEAIVSNHKKRKEEARLAREQANTQILTPDDEEEEEEDQKRFMLDEAEEVPGTPEADMPETKEEKQAKPKFNAANPLDGDIGALPEGEWLVPVDEDGRVQAVFPAKQMHVPASVALRDMGQFGPGMYFLKKERIFCTVYAYREPQQE